MWVFGGMCLYVDVSPQVLAPDLRSCMPGQACAVWRQTSRARAQVVPSRERSQVYAFDRCIAGLVGALSNVIVPLVAQYVFGFSSKHDPRPEGHQTAVRPHPTHWLPSPSAQPCPAPRCTNQATRSAAWATTITFRPCCLALLWIALCMTTTLAGCGCVCDTCVWGAQAQRQATAAENVRQAAKLENGLLIVMLVPMVLKLIVYRRAVVLACCPASVGSQGR